mmetsp:Transcript_7908/g.48866  ORF Transcript_7908/g.48866 Transcript_7908/m.48866 type:complete len:230 (+) Transcript_7908:187-876(+)
MAFLACTHACWHPQRPRNPPRRSEAATTRWHGTRGACGFRRSADPTARGHVPNTLAMARYVVTRPRGTRMHIAYTFRACTVQRTVSSGSRGRLIAAFRRFVTRDRTVQLRFGASSAQARHRVKRVDVRAPAKQADPKSRERVPTCGRAHARPRPSPTARPTWNRSTGRGQGGFEAVARVNRASRTPPLARGPETRGTVPICRCQADWEGSRVPRGRASGTRPEVEAGVE